METPKINLNFLELSNHYFNFSIYRKIYSQDDLNHEIFKYRLPQTLNNDEKFIDYCITFKPTEKFELFECSSATNIHLTLKYIYINFIEKTRAEGLEVSLGTKFYDLQINFNTKTHLKGNEVISLLPYYLSVDKKFGFLINYHFLLKKGEKNDNETRKIALMLDKYGRANKNYYSDKYHKFNDFIDNFLPRISTFEKHRINPELVLLNSYDLNKKEYIFKRGSDFNQFNGLRNKGVYQGVDGEVKYVFIFEEKFKSFANNLYLSLVGKSYTGTFSGMTNLFGLPFEHKNLDKIIINDYSKDEIERASNEIVNIKNTVKEQKIIAIFLVPNRFEGVEDTDSPYYNLKYHLIKNGIPLQVIREDKCNNANTLKWGSSNIGLQIFSKLGGVPWVLKPSQSECLILGIGSAYEKNKVIKEDGSEGFEIKKYFTYSVCLDSTGIYKKLEVLSEQTDKERYLKDLEDNLVKLFANPEFKKYRKCALHISEAVSKDAIERIQTALSKINDVEFKVLKFNTDNKFFGFSSHNTYVPYESSFIKLSSNEYLIWFDGLIRGNENIYQRVANPIHVKFLRSDGVSDKNDLEYLQDAINLSGANWRGFKAKQVPISIYYAKIVADYTKVFNSFEGFNKAQLSNNLPWFL